MTATQAIAYLRSPLAIRARSEAIFEAALIGTLDHFTVALEAMPVVVDEVVRITRERYPDLRIPLHGKINQVRDHVGQFGGAPDEIARAWIDLIVISVLVDDVLSPSEDLAIACLQAFERGAFSSNPAEPRRVDVAALRSLDAATIDGPLQSKTAVLRSLGEAMQRSPTLFPGGRPGGLLDYFRTIAPHQLPAAELLTTLLEGLSTVWPGGNELEGQNLGDVWRHRAAGGSGPSEGLVPFHGLAQWLAYSLFEPFERAGLPIAQPEALTGLAEYRNGGLLVDLGVLIPKQPRARALAHPPGDELIVEWRALTVALLDRVAVAVRDRLGASPLQLPLACVLEGGTWAAGRAVAHRLRPGGPPPIRVESY